MKFGAKNMLQIMNPDGGSIGFSLNPFRVTDDKIDFLPRISFGAIHIKSFQDFINTL